MASFKSEIGTWADGEDVDIRVLGPVPEHPATTTSVSMTIPFLTLPRELRDNIYRQLLATKYTRVVLQEPEIDSLKEDYEYRFHPAILRTNRQIEREASHILYTENLLVRISSSGPLLSANMFGDWGGRGHNLPILAAIGRAEHFTRHIMEVVLLREHVNELAYVDDIYDVDSYYSENCFIVAGDDLPRFCWALLANNPQQDRPLSPLALAIEISHDMDSRAIQREGFVHNQLNIEDETNNGNEDTKPKLDTKVESDRVNINREEIYKDSAPAREHDTTDREQASTTLISPRVCRLLEPFRALHSLEGAHIEGPISQQYKATLIASMCGPEPSEEDLFERVLIEFEDAMTTYEAGEFSSAIKKLKNALDMMIDCNNLSESARHASDPPWDAIRDLQFSIWYRLGWASLENRHSEVDVWNAKQHGWNLMAEYVDDDYQNAPPMGRDIAMVFYLLAEAQDALDKLQEYSYLSRSYELKQIIEYIQEGLRHEPGNELLRQQLRRREEELRSVEETEDLMEMSDRIYERGEYAPGRRGRGGSRGRGRGRGHWSNR